MMHRIPNALVFSGQVEKMFSGQNTTHEIIAYLLAATTLLFVLAGGVVLQRAARKRQGKGPAGTIDTDFLEGVRGNLSPDEMKRVRESMLRQIEEERRRKAEATSVDTLQALLQQRALTPDAPVVPPRKSATDFQPQPSLSPQQSLAVPPPSAPAKPAPIGIDALYEKGLISAEEYQRIKNHFNGQQA